ncbi:GMP synthase [archaeon]|nr:MAG: GMP synthase [archaeon]RLG64162.1 MAG: GMP synthase [archaeon]HDM23483.1 GMP synthase [Candidatus Bathyarchaeota archaeon]
MNFQALVDGIVDMIRRETKGKNALVALSGGIDSTVTAILSKIAIGDKLKCVFIDTGFMRERDFKDVDYVSNKYGLDVEIINAKDEFLSELLGRSDAEEKRRIFREIFYSVLGRKFKEAKCKYLIQGTIASDWIETKGGIKTQHNVLKQIGIDTVKKYGFKVIEPLADMYKDQVRELAKFLGLPRKIYDRQPFPGPGLLIRAVGKLTERKLDLARKATEIVEKELAEMNCSQYFAAVIDNKWSIDERASIELSTRIVERLTVKRMDTYATGIKGDLRVYGRIAALMDENIEEKTIPQLVQLQAILISKFSEYTRVVYNISRGNEKRKHAIIVRAVVSSDLMTANVAEISMNRLCEVAQKIKDEVGDFPIYYDVTPKPPATIEFE